MTINIESLLDSQAKELASSRSLVIAESLFEKFSDLADKLVAPFDKETGAVLLERYSLSANNDVKKFMLTKALERATCFASCATSGGEGLARSEHVKKLLLKLEDSN